MSFQELSDEQREIRELARRFADERVAPTAAARDEGHVFPAELLAELAELGLLGICVPECLGGAGADYLSYCLALEEFSRADASLGVTVAVHTGAVALPLVANADDDQAARLVPPMATGERLGAFALTESSGGSDPKAMRTSVDTELTISGTKQWITNGSHAGVVLVFAREGDGISAFVAAGDDPGLSVVREERKMGLHSSSTADLTFDRVRGERLGEPGAGMRIALSALDGGRIGIAAQAVGIAQAGLDVATQYAGERLAFGRPIAGFQAIQQKLADMQTEVAAARALVWRAARLKEAGLPHTVEGAQAKLFASRVARYWTGEAIQVLGGYGYTKEFPVERYYRDAPLMIIGEGTNEIQRLVIARGLLARAGYKRPPGVRDD